MKIRISMIFILACLVTSIFFNIYQYKNKEVMDQHTAQIDRSYVIELSRSAASIRDNDIELALEHALQADALLKFTSYFAKNNIHVSYSSILVTYLRNKVLKNEKIGNTNDLFIALNELTKHPTSDEYIDKLIMVLQT